jgi:hypothetical protein
VSALCFWNFLIATCILCSVTCFWLAVASVSVGSTRAAAVLRTESSISCIMGADIPELLLLLLKFPALGPVETLSMLEFARRRLALAALVSLAMVDNGRAAPEPTLCGGISKSIAVREKPVGGVCAVSQLNRQTLPWKAFCVTCCCAVSKRGGWRTRTRTRAEQCSGLFVCLSGYGYVHHRTLSGRWPSSSTV